MVKPVLRWLHKIWGNPDDIQRVVQDYRARFDDMDAHALEDLRRFCFVYDTTQVPGDPHTSAVNEGRRQAYIHITHMLLLTDADIEAPKPEPIEKDSRDEPRPPMDGDSLD